MSREFPDWINPWTAAQGKRRFGGTMPVKRMKRLAALLESQDDEEANFDARFFLDEDKRPVIELSVSAQLVLMCQASLEPYVQALERHSRLGVIESEGELKLLPPDYDPVQVDHGRLAMAELVEDELILALPQVPRNPAVEPVDFSTGDSPEADPEGDGTQNPFAGLREKLAEGK